MKHRLGFFDSGVGGLTVLKKVLERHGELEAVYLGDTERIPYGSRSKNEIQEIAREVVGWLNQQQISTLVVACNTTNSLAMEIVKKYSSVPVVGLIDSIPEMLFESRIGVLATPSTTFSLAYTNHILLANPDAFVIEQSCPSFVPLIEASQFSSTEIRRAAKKYLQPLLDAKVEVIVLGCSHYPLLKPLLNELIPENVRLVDPAIALSKRLDNFLDVRTLISLEKSPSYSNVRFCVTSDLDGFASRAKHWLGIRPEVELVYLRNKACVF